MKSKVIIPAQLGQKTSDVLKNSSFNFLENERYHTIVERGLLHGNLENSNSRPPYTQSVETQEKVDVPIKVTERLQEKSKTDKLVLSKERVEPGVFAPKRYVTTCYFETKQIPVWYSETVIFNVGSKKKKYFDSIYHENKLYPSRWSETMTTVLPGTEEVIIFTSDIKVLMEEPAFHYMSLEPQQLYSEQTKLKDTNDDTTQTNYITKIHDEDPCRADS